MTPLDGSNTLVLDLETAYSADDCLHCGQPEPDHANQYCVVEPHHGLYTRRGWSNYTSLGLSLGAYYDYQDGRIHWFDAHSLCDTVDHLLTRQPLIISFNGKRFDSAVMIAALPLDLGMARVTQWLPLWHRSYDLLEEVWTVAGTKPRGVNSLGALCQANGLGAKTGHGALAPRLWQQGRVADVLNYCQQDVYLTKSLVEHAIIQHGVLQRDGALAVRIALPLVPGD